MRRVSEKKRNGEREVMSLYSNLKYIWHKYILIKIQYQEQTKCNKIYFVSVKFSFYGEWSKHSTSCFLPQCVLLSRLFQRKLLFCL